MTAYEATDDQESLRKTVSQLLDREADLATTRTTQPRCPDPAWTELRAMGLLGLRVSEENGGAGAGLDDLAVVLRETGRRIVPGPYLAHAGLAAALLDAAYPSTTTAAHGSAMAEGQSIYTIAVATDEPIAEGDRFTGQLSRVPAGDVADALLIPRCNVDGSADILVVETAQSAVSVRPSTSVDPSTGFASVDLNGATGHVLESSLERIDIALARIALTIATEQIGAAEGVLSMVIDYVSSRQQFGRAIGSFQSVKHRCAELYVGIEQADASVRRAIAEIDDPSTPLVDAYLAAENADSALGAAARASIQFHGAIGFTWEHDAPRYLKRALGSHALLADVMSGVDVPGLAIAQLLELDQA